MRPSVPCRRPCGENEGNINISLLLLHFKCDYSVYVTDDVPARDMFLKQYLGDDVSVVDCGLKC